MKRQNGKRVIVIGCGAAGMFAAIAAASHGACVTVLEKNEKAGKKLYITGKGRCNLTNDCDAADFFDAVVRGGKFLYSAVYGYDAARVQRFFTERGCPIKIERGNRVFPVSDKSSDVIRTLTYEMRRLGVDVRYNREVRRLLYAEETAAGQDGAHSMPKNRVTGVQLADGETVSCDAVIVASGGLSYSSTGATGDGYAFARKAGHTVTERFPSLVPFETQEAWHRDLQGLTLKNVRLYSVPDNGCGETGSPDPVSFASGRGGRHGKKQILFDGQGELLFTHFGVSGPLVLSASACLPEDFFRYRHTRRASGQTAGDLRKHADGGTDGAGSVLRFAIDLKPALTGEELDRRLIRDFELHAKKQFANSLGGLFPSALVPVMARLAEAGMMPAEDGNERRLKKDGDSADNHHITKSKTGGKNAADHMIRIAPSAPAGTVTRAQRLAFGALIKRLPVTVTGTRGFSEAVITRGGVALKEINPSTMESKLCKELYFAGEVLDCDALTGGFNLQIAWSTGHLAGVSAAASDAAHAERSTAEQGAAGSATVAQRETAEQNGEAQNGEAQNGEAQNETDE